MLNGDLSNEGVQSIYFDLRDLIKPKRALPKIIIPPLLRKNIDTMVIRGEYVIDPDVRKQIIRIYNKHTKYNIRGFYRPKDFTFLLNPYEKGIEEGIEKALEEVAERELLPIMKEISIGEDFYSLPEKLYDGIIILSNAKDLVTILRGTRMLKNYNEI